MIALDTTALIDIFKAENNLKKLLNGLNDGFVTTSINCQEIYFGINYKEPRHLLEEEKFDNFFKEIIILDLDRISAKKSSEIFWELNRKGENIGKFDSMIAGTLLTNGINKIITKNKKHFERIKGLKVLSY